MRPRKVISVFYSATGKTASVVNRVGATIAEQFDCEYVKMDLTSPDKRKDIIEISSEDVLILGTSTYRGKMPVPIAKDLHRILKGNGSYAVAVSSFGNRAFENILAEMKALLEEKSFRPIAAGAFVAQHVYSDLVGTGRPDEDDLKAAEQFGKKAAELIRDNAKGVLRLPGDADAACYQPKGADGNAVNFHDAKPVTDLSKCSKCGLCVTLCPFGSIDKDMVTVSGECFKCHACIHGCGSHAKGFTDEIFLSHVKNLEDHQRGRKEIALFYAE